MPAANVELATKNSAASWCSCRWLRSQSDHKHRVTLRTCYRWICHCLYLDRDLLDQEFLAVAAMHADNECHTVLL